MSFNLKVGDKLTHPNIKDHVTVTAIGSTRFLATNSRGVEATLDLGSIEEWKRLDPTPFKVGDWVERKHADIDLVAPFQITRMEYRAYGDYWFVEGDGAMAGDHKNDPTSPYRLTKCDPPVKKTRYIIECVEKVPTVNDSYFSLAEWGRTKGGIVNGGHSNLTAHRSTHNWSPAAGGKPEGDPHGRGNKREVITSIRAV